jgi:RNA polymerase sigma-70 factor (ECF subfamily)
MSIERIEAARAGDPIALEQLMRERRTEVIRYAMRLCISPADAEDAAQEALLALARYVRSLREVAALSAWLFAAVRTHCTRLARRALRQTVSLDDASPLSLEGPSPEDQLVDRQLRHHLAVVLGEMDSASREVLLRRDVLGESTSEAAAALGLSVEALKSRLHRARAEAKKRLLASVGKPGPAAAASRVSIFQIPRRG